MVTDEGRSWKWVGTGMELKWNGFLHTHRRSPLVFGIRNQKFKKEVGGKRERSKVLRSGRGTK